MTWRARSASDRTDDWPYWYVTNDNPPDANKTAEAYQAVTGQPWPPIHQFLTRGLAEDLAKRMNEVTT